MEISLFIDHLEFFTACQTLMFDVVGLTINHTKKYKKNMRIWFMVFAIILQWTMVIDKQYDKHNRKSSNNYNDMHPRQ